MKPPVKPDRQLAATLLRLRYERGITQEELAYEADITISTMARIERGRSNPAWTTVLAIAWALGITLHDLAHAIEGADQTMRPTAKVAPTHADPLEHLKMAQPVRTAGR